MLQPVAASCVPGHSSWAEPVKELITVVYLDYEMTRSDLIERLTSFGYSHGEDYLRLHYLLAPGLGADLDTYEGGEALVAYCRNVGADLCVIDTTRKFDLHTGRLLKFYEIAFMRLDHAGKDKARGQRGSSAKNDDVDIVWELSRTDTGVRLNPGHTHGCPGVLTWCTSASRKTMRGTPGTFGSTRRASLRGHERRPTNGWLSGFH